jgi:hypothetical protein
MDVGMNITYFVLRIFNKQYVIRSKKYAPERI